MLQVPLRKGDKSKEKKRKNIRFVHKRTDESTLKSIGIVLPQHHPISAPTSTPLSSSPSMPTSAPSSTPFGTVSTPASVSHVRPRFNTASGSLLISSSTPPSSVPPFIPASSTPPSIPSASSTPPSTPSLSRNVPVETGEQNTDFEQRGNVLGSLRLDGRLCIGVHNKEFFPSCSSIIRATFEERVDPDGYKWVNISDTIKDFYWDEFEKNCYWDDTIGPLVKVTWKKKAKERYSQYIHNMSSRKKNPTRKKPTQLSPEVWTAWNAIWNSEEFKRKSKQNKINRRRGEENGKALPTHTSGSESHSNVATEFEKHLGHPPSCFELFVRTHTKNNDGMTFLVDRAKEIHDTYQMRTEELVLSGEKFDENKLFYEIVGGHDRKRKIYGLGSYGNSITCSKGFSNMFTSPNVEKERIETKTKIDNLENIVAEQKVQYDGVNEKLADFDDVKKQLAEALVVIKNLGDAVKVLTNNQ